MEDKRTQKDEIYWYLLEHGSITPLEALSEFGCMRLASRISELKKDGVEIRRELVGKKNSRGKMVYFAKYIIVRDKNWIGEIPLEKSTVSSLQQAVVLQAVKDYRHAKAVLKDKDEILATATGKRRTDLIEEYRLQERRLKDCERFFCGQDFMLFSKIDGPGLLEALRREETKREDFEE